MILSKYAKCGSKKSRFIEKQVVSGITSSLGLKTPLNKIPLLGDFFFLNTIPLNHYKMNEIVNKFLLAGDKFMPEMDLKQPEFTDSACGHLLKIKK